MSIEGALSKFGKILDRVIYGIKSFFIAIFEDPTQYMRLSSAQKHSSANSQYCVLLFDVFLAFISLFISIHLRIGMDFLDYSPVYILKNMLVFCLVSASIFIWFQTYQAFWRYTTVEDIIPIFLSVILSNILFFPLMMLMNQGEFLPYSVLVINAFVLSIALFMPRIICKIIYAQKLKRIRIVAKSITNGKKQDNIPNVLLVGNIDSIEAFCNEVLHNDEIVFSIKPVGILTLAQADIGRTIKGIPVLGELRDIKKVDNELTEGGVFLDQIVVTDKKLGDYEKKFVARYTTSTHKLLLHAVFQFSVSKLED